MAEPADPEAELRLVERQRLWLLVSGEVERARDLHADDFQLVNPAGGALSRDEYLGLIASGEFRYRAWDPGEITVRLYPTSAVVRYQAEIEAVIGGTPTPRGRYWHTDLYERRDDRWQVVWSQATEIR